MTNQIDKMLKKIELTADVKTALDNREKARKEEDNRAEGLIRLEEEYKTKENEIERLESAANRALVSGENPLTYINTISVVKKELETLKKFIPESTETTRRTELEQKQKLEEQISTELRIAFIHSSFKKEMIEQITAKLQEVEELFTLWDEVWSALFKKHNSQPGYGRKVDITLNNHDLQLWVKNQLSKIYYSENN